MQHKLYPHCNDPNPFNLNEHIVSAPLASDCFAPFDDVDIATGQAGFDDGGDLGHPELSTWINPPCSHELIEDYEDVSMDFGYKYGHRLKLLYRKH